MGQYFIIVNLEKREYILPHALKRGAKLLELSKDPIIYSLPTQPLAINSACFKTVSIAFFSLSGG